jgi:hypothetical protein
VSERPTRGGGGGGDGGGERTGPSEEAADLGADHDGLAHEPAGVGDKVGVVVEVALAGGQVEQHGAHELVLVQRKVEPFVPPTQQSNIINNDTSTTTTTTSVRKSVLASNLNLKSDLTWCAPWLCPA